MHATEISGHRPNILTGTIPASGTLSQEIDLREYTTFGLICESTTFVNGTLTFQAASKPEAEGGHYFPVLASNGVAAAVGPVSGRFVVSSAVLDILKPYRYIKIASSIAQSSEVTFKLPVKA